MKIINVLGKPCPIPVIESKKALAEQSTSCIQVQVDNIVAVQNLEKMSNGYGYDFSYNESLNNCYDVIISKKGKYIPDLEEKDVKPEDIRCEGKSDKLVVVISKDRMGTGSDELGKILIKGFIYSLTELKTPPESVIFLNSGVSLTSEESNAIDDLKKLEETGTNILSCGTCVNYFELQEKLAVGSITNMYGITEKMAQASNIINI